MTLVVGSVPFATDHVLGTCAQVRFAVEDGGGSEATPGPLVTFGASPLTQHLNGSGELLLGYRVDQAVCFLTYGHELECSAGTPKERSLPRSQADRCLRERPFLAGVDVEALAVQGYGQLTY